MKGVLVDTLNIYKDECENYIFIVSVGSNFKIGGIIEQEDLEDIKEDTQALIIGKNNKFTYMENKATIEWKKHHTPLAELALTGEILRKGQLAEHEKSYIEAWEGLG